MNTWRISSLSEVPHFADVVAERGWTAWWTGSGVPLSDYRKHLAPMLAGTGLEQGFVAHAGDTYLGSALLIENDLDARPLLRPWLAALWVDEPFRRRGIATALMEAARHAAGQQGIATVYLCALPAVSSYYLSRGWRQIEADVTGLNLFESPTG